FQSRIRLNALTGIELLHVLRVRPESQLPPALLLREANREGGKISKKTLANLTHWPEHVVEGMYRLLRRETLVPKDSNRSTPHPCLMAVA
ncbi:MAG: hypothetical protein M3Y08_19860, partial [Fibrobacterota bacterium]|nr:hypothetical protein [Fibrobacterota bacterium]